MVSLEKSHPHCRQASGPLGAEIWDHKGETQMEKSEELGRNLILWMSEGWRTTVPETCPGREGLAQLRNPRPGRLGLQTHPSPKMPTQSLVYNDPYVLSSSPAHLGHTRFSPAHFILCKRGWEVMCPRPHGPITKRKEGGSHTGACQGPKASATQC